MSEGSKRPIILPPFQAILVQKLPVIYDSLISMAENPQIIWRQMLGMDAVVPKEIYNKFHPEVQKIKDVLSSKQVRGVDAYHRNKDAFVIYSTYLNSGDRIRNLVRLFFNILDEEGYLKQLKGYGELPKSGMEL